MEFTREQTQKYAKLDRNGRDAVLAYMNVNRIASKLVVAESELDLKVRSVSEKDMPVYIELTERIDQKEKN